MKVIPGPASQDLGRKVAALLRADIIPTTFKTFPDGESYLRLEGDVYGETVAIVQTTGPPQNTNLIQLFLMVDAAKDLGAKEVKAVVPYFAYARQDRRFLSGEVFSIKTIVTLLKACGVTQIVTVNFHNPEILNTFSIPVHDLSAIGLLATYFKDQGLDRAFSLSLGKKAVDVTKQANGVLGGGYDCIPTQRDRVTGKVKIEPLSLPINDRDVIIFDDIISSGGTMAKAVKAVKQQGARRIFAACVHPLLIGDAKKNILDSGADGIVGTDCITRPESVVSVAPLLAEALRDNPKVTQ